MSHTRRMVTFVLIAVMVLGVANMAVAAKKKAKGQDLYKEFCKPCHEADSPNGEYTPMTLIQDQWKRFFEEDYEATHGEALVPSHDNKPVTEVITEEDFEKIKKWTIDHAADSEQPMTCG